MKFSDNTIQVLKNFALIHPALTFKPGKTVAVISETRSMLASAKLDVNIDKTFAIHDMSSFLNSISMFEEPELEVGNTYVDIKKEKEGIKYALSSPDLIPDPPEKFPTLPSKDLEFKINKTIFSRIMKGAGIVGADTICIIGDKCDITIECRTIHQGSRESNSGSQYQVEVGTTPYKFKFIFSTENFSKIKPDDYDVSICKDGLAHFASDNIQYWVTVEASSYFEDTEVVI